MKTRKSKMRKNKTQKKRSFCKSININEAKNAADAMEQYAKKKNVLNNITICIVDKTGYPILLQRYSDTPYQSDIAQGKAKTAALYGKPTHFFDNSIKKEKPAFVTLDYIMLAGGIPIKHNGKVIGAISCSGASSSKQDEEIVSVGIKAILKNKTLF